jgi:cellulose synthase/poly-beta-1,6-N-acetylglucosamine synthase-like glycosyltransferase
MYIHTYIAILLWIFAIFGFICFILRVFQGLYWQCHRNENFSIIITAKNQQETIEGVIRGFILKLGIDGTEEALLNIVLVDAGSSDDTPKIMERLSNEYCCIKLLKPKELSTFLENLIGGRK